MPELSTFSATSTAMEQAQNNASEQQNSQSQQQAASSESAPASGEQAQQQADNSSSTFDIGFEESGNGEQQNGQQQQQPQYNWKDEIKKVDPKELAQEIGIDPFALELNNHIKSGGQAIDYLQARAIDYNKFSDESLIKNSLKKQFPTFEGDEIDDYFKDKYGVDETEFSGDLLAEKKRIAELRLKGDAYNLRQQLIAEQQRFKVPDTPIPQKDEAYEQWKQYKQTEPQQIEELRSFYTSHPATKALNESKKVTINLGEGVAPFNFVISKPEFITKVLTDDGSTWRTLTSTPQGEPDVAKMQLLTLVASNPQKFIQDIFNYGQSMGVRKELVEEGQNAVRPQAKVTSMINDAKQTVTVKKYSDVAK